MNDRERKMAGILKRGREELGVVSVKAEFEAEGTRPDELLRLLEIAARVDLPLTIKIGGCEALWDLMQAKLYGAGFVVAPMIESPYALSKYVGATRVVYEEAEGKPDFLFNIETLTGFDNTNELVKFASNADVAGVVFGRSDFTESTAGRFERVNDPGVTRCVLEVSEACRKSNLDLVVGGGVSVDSLGSLREISKVKLTRFETRKVVFAAEALDAPDIERGLLTAVHFELLWLMNKRDYYGRIHVEDEKRIETLESRWHVIADDIV